jgi:hypothetical protein
MSITGLGEAFDFGSKLLGIIFPDKTQAEAAKTALAQAGLNGQLQEVLQIWDNAKQQALVNAEEAKNTSIFVAGWRPFIGWCCGAVFAWTYIGQPLGVFIAACFGKTLSLPVLNISEMMPVLLGILGLGAMRSYDKQQGSSPSTHA